MLIPFMVIAIYPNCHILSSKYKVASNNTTVANKYSVILDSLNTSIDIRRKFHSDLHDWEDKSTLPIHIYDSLIPAVGATLFIKEYIYMKYPPEEIQRVGYDSLHKKIVREQYRLGKNITPLYSKDLASIEDAKEPKLIVFIYPLDSNVVIANVFPYTTYYKESYNFYSTFISEVHFLIQFNDEGKIVKIVSRELEK